MPPQRIDGRLQRIERVSPVVDHGVSGGATEAPRSLLCHHAPHFVRGPLGASYDTFDLDLLWAIDRQHPVDAITPAELSPCEVMLISQAPRDATAVLPGWRAVARIARPTDRQDITVVYRREPASR